MLIFADCRALAMLAGLVVSLASCPTRAADPPAGNKPNAVPKDAQPQGAVRAWKYRIVVDSYRHVTLHLPSRSTNVPEHDIGELLLDPKSGRFVYRIQNDDETWRKYAASDNKKVHDKPEPLASCAGFDGERFWYARFPRTALLFGKGGAKDFASHVHIFDSRDILGKSFGKHGYGWYLAAPLHHLLMRIDCKTWDYDAVSAALSASKFASVLSPEAMDQLRVNARDEDPPRDAKYFVYSPWDYILEPKSRIPRREAGQWEFLVELDRQPISIRRCLVQYPGAWRGPWPYPTPEQFYLIRDGEKDGFSAKDFTYDAYVDKDTRVERHSR